MFKLKPEWKEIDGEKWYKFDTKLERNKHFYGNLIAVLALLFLIVFGAYSIEFMRENSRECLRNPLNYGITYVGDGSATCSCNIINDDDKLVIFNFNSTAIWYPAAVSGSKSPFELNWTMPENIAGENVGVGELK